MGKGWINLGHEIRKIYKQTKKLVRSRKKLVEVEEKTISNFLGLEKKRKLKKIYIIN